MGPRLNTYSRNNGFTLLEAMIALVVFSVALLGLAGMYTQMMSMSHSAYFRTLATIQANDLEERIRANPDGDYTAAAGCAALPAGAPADFQNWCDNSVRLFGGLLTTATVTSSVDNYTITLAWRERGLDNAAGDQALEAVSFSYVVRR